jgi:glyoxylase I family protein
MSTLLYSREQPMAFNGSWGLRHKVADIERATEFYVQQLGFRLDHQNPPHTRQLSSGSLKLTLTSDDDSECTSMSDVCNRGSERQSRVVLHVQDLRSRIENLKRAGMVFAKEMEVSPNGKHIQFEDPDGNRIELFEPSTLLSTLDSQIVSHRQSFNEWMIAILLSLLILGLFLGAMAVLLFVNK